ncbi:hypothetical protein TNCV_1029741 [Trichonephila clavipes]|nr:hypothetical protein TNCV_1029741 [Trichonephila clavipes]
MSSLEKRANTSNSVFCSRNPLLEMLKKAYGNDFRSREFLSVFMAENEIEGHRFVWIRMKCDKATEEHPKKWIPGMFSTANAGISLWMHEDNVAREFDIAHSVVSRLWKSFKTTGMCSRRHGGGRVRSTTPTEDRYIVLSAKRNRRTTAQQVANQFLMPQESRSPKNCCQTFEGEEDYTHADLLCVSY